MRISSLALFVALFITMQASAQKAFNVEVGVNASKRYVNARTMKPFSNYVFGVSWDLPLKNENMFVRIGAGFAQDSKKIYEDIECVLADTFVIGGQTYNEGSTYLAGESRTSLTISNLDIPITIGYKMELSGLKELNVQAGLVWSRHLSGSQYTKIIDNNPTKTEDIERTENIWFGSGDADWRRADLGLTVKAGLTFPLTFKENSHLFELGLTYSMGLLNQYHVEDVARKEMTVWPTGSSYGTYDYAVTPEKLQRITLTLAYVIETE